jgi:hypothetical protein
MDEWGGEAERERERERERESCMLLQGLLLSFTPRWKGLRDVTLAQI